MKINCLHEYIRGSPNNEFNGHFNVDFSSLLTKKYIDYIKSFPEGHQQAFWDKLWNTKPKRKKRDLLLKSRLLHKLLADFDRTSTVVKVIYRSTSICESILKRATRS